MKILYLLIFFLGISVSKETRIIGGQEAHAGQFAFVAAIYVTTSTGRYFCSGALHGDQWIITAAQCASDAVLFTIHLGSNSLSNTTDPNKIIVSTSEYLAHPDYNPETLDSDIALIKLRMPVEFNDYLKPIYNVPVGNTPAEWNVLAIGWGQTSNDDPELVDHLNWVILTTVTNDECKITYGNQISDNMLCAAGNYNQGTCLGDTGSPLVYLLRYGNVQLVGVSSFISGNGCEATDPSGYTRVFHFSEWIANITGIPPK